MALKGLFLSADGSDLQNALSRHLTSYGSDAFHWTAPKIVLSIFLFFVAGLAEIGGGWLVWQAVRGRVHVAGQHWWLDKRCAAYAVLGGLTLVSYGFIPTAQPPPTFGRLYAVYGGFFILMSFLWGWVVDKDRPDKGGHVEPSVLMQNDFDSEICTDGLCVNSCYTLCPYCVLAPVQETVQGPF